MARHCTCGLYFTRRWLVKYKAHLCNISPYATPPHAMINLLYTNTKRDGYNDIVNYLGLQPVTPLNPWVNLQCIHSTKDGYCQQDQAKCT